MKQLPRGTFQVGLGLRWEFLEELEVSRPASLDFLEIAPENYMERGGTVVAALERLRDVYPLVSHGLCLSVGGVDPVDGAYLDALRGFLQRYGMPFHSDHLCFGSYGGRRLHDLLPLAFTEATVTRVVERVRRIQDALGLPFAVENISSYVHPGQRTMTEGEFLARVCEGAPCGFLFDVNNLYVNIKNFGFDGERWLREAPLDRVVQIHMAGHEWFHEVTGEPCNSEDEGAPHTFIVDTHGSDVHPSVERLLATVLPRTGPVPVLLERDQNFPTFEQLLVQVERLRHLGREALIGASPVTRGAGEERGAVREGARDPGLREPTRPASSCNSGRFGLSATTLRPSGVGRRIGG